MMFTEDSRVKIPTILHLIRLGYDYLTLNQAVWNSDTNIFTNIFKTSVSHINPETEADDIKRLLEEITLLIDNEDLGEAFYEKLTARSGIRLIDFEDFSKNSFHVVTELTYKNGDDEFRPDITLLINGMPLVFIEVKKPNNREGILAERERINKRFQNAKFRRFVNITQFMLFSNNMEYDDKDPEPVQGAFYASSSYHQPVFNYFREEEELNLTTLLRKESDAAENRVLADNNLQVIKHNEEFTSNKEPGRPTNRICTSLLSHERLAFMLQYALVYVKEYSGIQKHIMRYPQLFATKAIERRLNERLKKGIIWHTQGSGKTALTYYNVRFLTHYFQRKEVIPKFYFIVDRLDLLNQAHREFSSRGLSVRTINSREDFAREIKGTGVIGNLKGKPEITVVNIQKFKDDPDIIPTRDYSIDIQRIYFLDEVHRSYKPGGSFLANLYQSDRNAIKIGLTGTPLITEEKKSNKKAYSSKEVFGDYMHKYYYNASIADGYTLRLIREEIANNYKMKLQQALQDMKIVKGDIKSKQIYAHPRFVEPMLDYIITDFEKSRRIMGDVSIGAMVVCHSSEQAKKLFESFNNRDTLQEQPEDKVKHASKVKSAALILHDIGSREERKEWIEDFKAGKIDLLFVYNMLQTGFDAKRLKKLYLGRVITRHNLLQTLTRVNRTYKHFRYGYVVDFADIRSEFNATNRAYFNELQSELGDEIEYYSDLFKPQGEINAEIEHINEVLLHYNTENAEIFSDQINEIKDKEKVLDLKKVLDEAKELYNFIRLQDRPEYQQVLDFKKLEVLLKTTNDRLSLLNLKENLEKDSGNLNILNVALEDILFEFFKINEEELVLADELKNILRQTRETLNKNFDQQDPEFITLKEELERLFKKKKLNEVTQSEMNQNIGALNKIYAKVKELNRKNDLLQQKCQGDKKYTRIHKRLLRRDDLSATEEKISAALTGIKQNVDEQVLNNTHILNNESYFTKKIMPAVIQQFEAQGINLNLEILHYINKLVVTEYMKEFNNGANSK